MGIKIYISKKEKNHLKNKAFWDQETKLNQKMLRTCHISFEIKSPNYLIFPNELSLKEYNII